MNTSSKMLAKAFNLTLRYIDDLISISNPRFKQFLKDIYPEEPVVSEISESRNVRVILGFTDSHIQIVALFAQFLTRGMHLILILSIFLTYLGTPQLMVHTSYS